MKDAAPFQIKIGLPKGSLEETTFDLLRKAGFFITVSHRSYLPKIDDEQIYPILIRAQEISRYVEDGTLDCGLTGKDWIEENNSDVIEVTRLVYAKSGMRPVRWVLAVPENSPIKSVKDLQGKKIATEIVSLTRRYLQTHGVTADVEFSWGATEIKVPELADAIVELTETGSSLKANKLRIVDVVLESTTCFIAHKKTWEMADKRKKIERIAMLLHGAINAYSRVGIKMNVPRHLLDKVISLLPSLNKPTVSHLTQDDWLALEVIVEEKTIRELIPALKEVGAEGIIEYPLNKVIF